MRNQEIIRKADLALSDIASAGKLNPEQANRFVRVLIDQPTLLAQVRTVTMGSPVQNINKIGFGSRILRAATENAALSSGNRVKPSFSQVQITTSEVQATIYIPYGVLEDNVEGGNPNVALQQGAGGMHQTIVDLMAERAALDLEEWALLADTGSGDAYLALQDGYLKRITTNVVDALGATYSKDLVKSAIKTMPTKYRRNLPALQNYIAINNEVELRDTYANRQTPMGDQQITGNLPLYSFGTQVKGVALMPSDKGIFVNPQNLIFGIQRNIMVEYDKNIETRQFIVVLTARVGLQIEQEDACVKTINIT